MIVTYYDSIVNHVNEPKLNYALNGIMYIYKDNPTFAHPKISHRKSIIEIPRPNNG